MAKFNSYSRDHRSRKDKKIYYPALYRQFANRRRATWTRVGGLDFLAVRSYWKDLDMRVAQSNFLFILFYFFGRALGLRDLSSPTKDRTLAAGTGSAES